MENSNKIAFVTGGSGFVGRNLIPFLIEKGYTVRALARSENSAKKVLNLGAIPVMGDLENVEAISQGLQGCDSIFHLAASVDFFASIESLRQLHVVATQDLLKLAAAQGIRNFVYLSAASVAINGKPLSHIDEHFVSDHFTEGYSLTKYEAEQAVLKYRSDTMRTIALRPPLIWGNGDPNALPQMIEAIEKKQMMLINGGKHQFITCHVLNVCHAMYLADNHQSSGKTYFITDLEEPVFKDFIGQYVGTQGYTLPNLSIPIGLARFFAGLMASIWKTFKLKGHPPIYPGLVNVLGLEFTVNTQLAEGELGYQPIISIEEGMKRMKK